MKTLAFAAFYAAASLVSTAILAKDIAPLTVTAEGIGPNGFIDPEYAFCIPAPKDHVKGGNDKSIGLSWSPGPMGTKSYAVIAVDSDVPTKFDNAGKEGRVV